MSRLRPVTPPPYPLWGTVKSVARLVRIALGALWWPSSIRGSRPFGACRGSKSGSARENALGEPPSRSVDHLAVERARPVGRGKDAHGTIEGLLRRCEGGVDRRD